MEPSTWPAFDPPLLADIAAAFFRRWKAIAYRSCQFSCGREFSESAERTFERFNLDLWGGRLRLSVWADGCLWLSVCVSAVGRDAGWAYKDAFYGNAQDVSAVTLVNMIQATLALPLGTDPITEREQLHAVWRRVYPYQA